MRAEVRDDRRRLRAAVGGKVISIPPPPTYFSFVIIHTKQTGWHEMTSPPTATFAREPHSGFTCCAQAPFQLAWGDTHVDSEKDSNGRQISMTCKT
jgi:hypothetical protein